MPKFRHGHAASRCQAVGKMGGTGKPSSPGVSGGSVVGGCGAVSGAGFGGIDGLKSGSGVD